MTGIHSVQVYGHTAQGASTAQVHAMCKNLKMGTVGKTQACAISTVAWFFGERRVPQIATRVEQVSEWITMWRGFNVDTGAEFVRSGRKPPLCWRRIPDAGTKRHVRSLQLSARFLEAGSKTSSPGFWQAPDANGTLDGALFK